MNAIRIRRCRLRVVRHGGWSWGADPRGLLKQVTQRLPRWLAQALAEQLADCAPDVAIASLRVRVPVRLGELYALPEAAAGASAGTAVAAPALRAVEARLAEAVRAAMPEDTRAERVEQIVAAGAAGDDDISPTPVIDVMCGWHAAGTLEQILAGAGGEALAAWIDGLLVELDDAARRRAVPRTAVAPVAARLAALHVATHSAPVLRVEALLAVIESLVPRAAGPQPAATSAEDVVPPLRARDGAMPVNAPLPGIQSHSTRPSAARARTTPLRQPNRGPMPIASVLPFVVIGVLSRLGYLDALRAALACAKLEADAECFAAAITCKLAPPPDRGWNRGPATLRLIAAMCGREEAPPNAHTLQFLRRWSAVCGPLDAALRSRRTDLRHHAILLDKPEPGLWAAMDVAGASPLGWLVARADLATLGATLTARSWWLAPGAAHADLIDELLRRDGRVVTIGAPQGSATCRAIGHELWSNDPVLRGRSLRLRRAIDEARATLAAVHAEFIVARPLDTPARGSQRVLAEYSVALAATTALAIIAETLWRKREATTPLLALQRFADLSGTVSFEEGRVLVRPALGRRFMDLHEHGLLRDIARVPWWPGRHVEFVGP